MKNIDYFDHEADIGIIGRGHTLEEAFQSAAEAVFNIITPLSHIQYKKSLRFEFNEPDVELALVTWLNLLLGESYSRNWVFGKFKLIHHSTHWEGKAWGEPWRNDLERGTDVKGATLTMLSVKKLKDFWEAKCIMDV